MTERFETQYTTSRRNSSNKQKTSGNAQKMPKSQTTFTRPKQVRGHTSGIDAIKHHNRPRTPHGKMTKHIKHHIQESQKVSPHPAGATRLQWTEKKS